MSQSIFAMLAAVTVVSAGAAMTLRSPVYCAIWFGLSLVGTAGLFLIQGAQFLAVATIVVYAGAILVTFLFLLMLAEPSGRARYDRTSWEGMLSAFSGAVLVGLLTMTVTGVLGRDRGPLPPTRVTGQERQQGVLAEEHVRRIGEELFGHEALFGRYLVAVEAAGALLLAALVGAAVIVGRARGPLAASEAAPLPRPDSGEDAHGRG
jgi:NADH-quinone oxidoreductase subunit J